jgi:hypothetical protein
MPKKKSSAQKQCERAFERVPGSPEDWLKEKLPLLCEAVRMKAEMDPWERRGKIVRADGCTESRRHKFAELSLNVDHFSDEESGAL